MNAIFLNRMFDRLRGTFKRFRGDAKGVSAVEFGLLLPIMAALYLGGTSLTQGIIIKRKVVLVSHTVGDLVARDNVVTTAEMNSIFDAAKAVFAPYSWSPHLKIKISSVRVDSAGAATVRWGQALQDTARATGATVTLPAGLNTPNSTVIWAEVSYVYTPVIGSGFTGGPLTMTDQIYIRPRLVAEVCLNTSPC
jgi:Flp pilus assembly protein TadG